MARRVLSEELQNIVDRFLYLKNTKKSDGTYDPCKVVFCYSFLVMIFKIYGFIFGYFIILYNLSRIIDIKLNQTRFGILIDLAQGDHRAIGHMMQAMADINKCRENMKNA